MAAQQVSKACSAEGKNPQQEGSAGLADAAKTGTPTRCLAGRQQSTRLSRSVALLITKTEERIMQNEGLAKATTSGVLHSALSILHLERRLPMKPVARYQSKLLFRKSYKPSRFIRIRPVTKLNFVFRPVRFGLKPKIESYECESH